MNAPKHLMVVIDDEEDIIENYRSFFEDDFTLRSFSDPNLFLEAIDKGTLTTLDVMITDLKMPGMDGIEMIKRAQKKGLFFPFILLSGFLDKKSVLEAVDVGAYRLLEKPASHGELMAAVDQLLIEHDIIKVRNQIREITSQLRELYTGIRMIMTQYIPEDVIDRLVIDAPGGRVQSKMSFEQLLGFLEKRLDQLLNSEKILIEMRANKMRA